LQGHTFHSAEQLAAYLGLVPVERQSGTSVLRTCSPFQSRPCPRPCRTLHGRHCRLSLQPSRQVTL
jgi:hypothetical protein